MADEVVVTKGKNSEQVVIDKATGSISDLWKKEDYWAIWLGFILLLAGVLIYFNNRPAEMDQKIAQANQILAAEAARAPFKTIAWHKATDAKKKLKAVDAPVGKWIKSFTNKPHGWSSNPLDSFVLSKSAADAKNQAAMPKNEAAQAKAAATLATAQTAENAVRVWNILPGVP